MTGSRRVPGVPLPLLVARGGLIRLRLQLLRIRLRRCIVLRLLIVTGRESENQEPESRDTFPARHGPSVMRVPRSKPYSDRSRSAQAIGLRHAIGHA